MAETARRDGPERLLTGYAGRLSLVLALGQLATNVARQVLPPLLPTILEALSITPTKAGFALTVTWGLFAAVQYPGGRLSDALSRKTVLVAALATVVAGCVVLVRLPTYAAFLAGVGLLGAGAGLYVVSMRALLSDLFVERRGQAIGFNQAAGNVGSILASGLALAVVAYASWEAAFLVVVGLLCVVAVLLHRRSEEAYVVASVDLGVRETVARVFGRPRLRLLVAGYTLAVFAWQGAMGFLPTVLRATKGFSPALANAGFALVFVVGIASMPVAGRLSDRRARVPIAGVALLVGAVGLSVLVLARSVPAVLLGLVVLSAGLMSFPPVMQAHLMDGFRETNVGGDFGAVRTVYIGLGSLGATYVGAVGGRWGYDVAYAGLVGCLLVAAAVTLWLFRPGR